MSSKPPVPLGKKNGGFPKLVKPFTKSMLFKIKGKNSGNVSQKICTFLSFTGLMCIYVYCTYFFGVYIFLCVN